MIEHLTILKWAGHAWSSDMGHEPDDLRLAGTLGSQFEVPRILRMYRFEQELNRNVESGQAGPCTVL